MWWQRPWALLDKAVMICRHGYWSLISGSFWRRGMDTVYSMTRHNMVIFSVKYPQCTSHTMERSPKSTSSWWRHQMETFSTLLAHCAGNSPDTGEFPSQRPVTLSADVSFDLRLNKHSSKQSRGWWFETPSCSLWRHRKVLWRQFQPPLVASNIFEMTTSGAIGDDTSYHGFQILKFTTTI